MGPVALQLPPRAFEPVLRSAQRDEYARRYWAMIEGNESFGVKVTWVGKGKEPESSYHYDYSVREKHIEWLREQAGIPGPAAFSPEDEHAATRAAWHALRQQRRQKR